MRPVFADPKTGFIFKRLFGSEAHKSLLIELLKRESVLAGLGAAELKELQARLLRERRWS